MNKKITRNNFSVLIVDDQQGMLDTLYDILEDDGYQVDMAENGIGAIEKNRDKNFDVILMDIIMPGKNGVEALKEIKEINPNVIVILMTAYTAPDLIAEAQKSGVYECLSKPFKPEKLLAILKKLKDEKKFFSF